MKSVLHGTLTSSKICDGQANSNVQEGDNTALGGFSWCGNQDWCLAGVVALRFFIYAELGLNYTTQD